MNTTVSTSFGQITVECHETFELEANNTAVSVCDVMHIDLNFEKTYIHAHSMAMGSNLSNAQSVVINLVDDRDDDSDGDDGDADGNDGDSDGEDEDSDSDGDDSDADGDDDEEVPFIEFDIDMADSWWEQVDLETNAHILDVGVDDWLILTCPGYIRMQNAWGTMTLGSCGSDMIDGQTVTECELSQIATWTNHLSLGLSITQQSSENVGTCRLQRSDGWVDDGDDDDWDDEDWDDDWDDEDWDDDEDNDDENDNEDDDHFGVDAHSHGFINIEIDDELVQAYLVSVADWTGPTYNKLEISEDSNSFMLDGGGNFILTDEDIDVYTPNSFAGFPLLGKELTYTVDRNEVGCACNSALYTVTMPGYNSDQEPDVSDWGNYYCDANKVAGVFCPEMDISEANRFTMASVPHRCSQPDGKYYPECDRAGCGTNIFHENEWAMGPGADFMIDTTRPYTHSTAFEKNAEGKLSGIKNTLSQDDASFEFYTCGDQQYLEDMTDYLEKDMTIIFSQWGGERDGMSWLDGMTECDADCNIEQAKTIYSDLKIRTIQES